jgi:inosose dehydratase
VLEFESKAESPGYTQVLDEIRQSGYAGTELGDWGFMPTDPAALRDELGRRQLTMLGAFVTTRLIDPASYAESTRTAVKTATLLSSVATSAAPFIVLSDEPTADPTRARMAGRITPDLGLNDQQWHHAARGVEQIARAVRGETGLRTVVHHHCATYVETPAEIDRLLALTDPTLVGLCLDSGHVTYGGGDPRDVLGRHRARVWHVHFKDCEPAIAAEARQAGWDYQTALGHGLFCELGRGTVDFTGLLADLRTTGFDGWVVVEQDVLPAMGAPLASATRNREYLKGIGI